MDTAKRITLLWTLFAAMPAQAQTGAYKLLVTTSAGGVTVVDYPSRERCERARAAIRRDAQDRISNSRENVPPNAIITSGPRVFDAICIPG